VYSVTIPPGQIKSGLDFGLATPASLVKGARIVAGSARLFGKTGCARGLYTARVRGKRILRVAFRLDGRKLRSRRAGSAFVASFKVSELRKGVHRIRAQVTFKAGTSPKSETLRLSFQRCSGVRAPRFTL
jgi:hypothetical protein